MSTVQSPRASEVAQSLTLGRDARKLLEPGLSAGAYVQRLLKEEQWIDAIRFMGRALSPRKAVWWACLCARHVAGDRRTPEQSAALIAATRWVVKPDEANRTAAAKVGKPMGKNSVFGCLARAAGSKDPKQAARLVAATVQLAAAEADTAHRHRQYLYIALDVEADALPWE
jgi:hypothetical protein